MAIAQIENGQQFGTVRKNINDNFQQLDDEIKNTANTIKSDGIVVFGTYIGDGAESRNINLGFEPVAVEVFNVETVDAGSIGIALRNSPSNLSSSYTNIEINSSGFTVFCPNTSYQGRSNINKRHYHFAAFKAGIIVNK